MWEVRRQREPHQPVIHSITTVLMIQQHTLISLWICFCASWQILALHSPLSGLWLLPLTSLRRSLSFSTYYTLHSNSSTGGIFLTYGSPFLIHRCQSRPSQKPQASHTSNLQSHNSKLTHFCPRKVAGFRSGEHFELWFRNNHSKV